MARLGDEFLDEDAVVAEGVLRLVLRRLETFAGFFGIPGNAHALAAAAGRGLDHHGIADLIGDLHRLVGIGNQAHMAGHRRNTGFGASFFEVILSPMAWIAPTGGPIKVTPAFSSASAKAAFSERKP